MCDFWLSSQLSPLFKHTPYFLKMKHKLFWRTRKKVRCDGCGEKIRGDKQFCEECIIANDKRNKKVMVFIFVLVIVAGIVTYFIRKAF